MYSTHGYIATYTVIDYFAASEIFLFTAQDGMKENEGGISH
jgi:hypothetical protein